MEKGKIFETKTAKETQKAGEILAREILVFPSPKRATVLCLNGDLGGGKTTFLQGFARGLGIKEKILSPTFVILKRFELKNNNYKNFYHMDCYRLQNARELETLGFKDILNNPQNIIAIEWAANVKSALPKNSLTLGFDFLGERKRRITLESHV